jgi:endonuclease/exonuclease/phosphatase family metal-dependent hydrolase
MSDDRPATGLRSALRAARRRFPLLMLTAGLAMVAAAAADPPTLRVASYNASLNDDAAGGLVARLAAGDERARRIAAVIQAVRPDLLLLNEFDHDDEGHAAALWRRDYLAVGQFGERPIDYPYAYAGPVNTGVASGRDLDRDGRSDGPGDAWGFGRHPGQYGMLVLSRFPIDTAALRSFREFRWAALPGAHRPFDPVTGADFNPDEDWRQLRLSSKAHWDLPIDTPLGRLHFLVAHPTPPAFDGPERRNARRNFDEIRLWAEYLAQPSRHWLVDDEGRRGGLPADARFVIAGDYNADPNDGSSLPGAIAQLLGHPRVLPHAAPRSAGAAAASAAAGGVNAGQLGDPAEDTAAFGRAGHLRVDYVLPSRGFEVVASGVHWPLPGQPGGDWIEASDHRLVWVDLGNPTATAPVGD